MLGAPETPGSNMKKNKGSENHLSPTTEEEHLSSQVCKIQGPVTRNSP